MHKVGDDPQSYDIFAEIFFPPFAWVRCSARRNAVTSLIDHEGWGDATDWVLYSRSVVRSDLRNVLKRLPVTVHPTLRKRDEWIEPSSPQSNLLEGLTNT